MCAFNIIIAAANSRDIDAARAYKAADTSIEIPVRAENAAFCGSACSSGGASRRRSCVLVIASSLRAISWDTPSSASRRLYVSQKSRARWP